jgi:four helix bundle protein
VGLKKLKVYGTALATVARLASHSASWDKRHAVVDQLCRASESIVLNLAEGARLSSSSHKQQLLDYATGSALEGAACLDIAVVKRFLLPELAAGEKRSLWEVVSMLVGLRRSWEKDGFREEPPPYGSPRGSEGWYFAHERLDGCVDAPSIGWKRVRVDSTQVRGKVCGKVPPANVQTPGPFQGATSVCLGEFPGRLPWADESRRLWRDGLLS